MRYKVTTKQGTNYIVSDDEVIIWLHLERDLGYTMPEAYDKAAAGSLNVITYIIWKAATLAGHTQTMTQDGFVTNEFDGMELLVDDDGPKDTGGAASDVT
jgi:hypothetical protein